MRNRFLIIANAAAGQAWPVARGGLVDAVAHALTRSGAEVAVVRSASPEAAQDAARRAVAERAVDAVVAAGGDSTVRGIGQVLLGHDLPLGLVPCGTANVLAREIGLAHDPDAIADTLREGALTTLRPGLVDGAAFFLWTGLGLDARVTARVSPVLKRRLGKAAYLAPGLAEVARPLERLEVTVDGTRHAASWVVVAKARAYAGAFALLEESRIGAPDLTAVLFKSASRAAQVGQLLALARGRLGARRDVERLACSRVVIEADVPHALQIEGEVVGLRRRVEVRAGHETLALIVPRAPARQNG